MPHLQTLSLTDRATPTPVAHVFNPVGFPQPNIGEVANNSGVPVGYERATVSMKKTNTRYKGRISLMLPIVATETVNGVERPVVVRTTYVDLNFSFDERSTEQERKNAVGMAQDALATGKVLVNDALIKLEGVY